MSSWRFIAVRALTGEILDWNVPFQPSSNPRRDLSGPSGMTGTIQPDYNFDDADDGLPILEEWATSLFLEVGGRILWGGIVAGIQAQGAVLTVTCVGYAGYASGIPYLGAPINSGVKHQVKDKKGDKLDKNHDGYIDGKPRIPKNKVPAAAVKDSVTPTVDGWDIVRQIWTHIQAQPHGNIGLQVTKGKLGQTMGADNGSDPYQLSRWDNTDCGEEIDNIAEHLSFDYIESHNWAADNGHQIEHHLHLAKNIGTKRDDISFVQGENVLAIATPQGMGGEYCNDAFVIGRGTGAHTKTAHVTQFDGKHLRRAQVVSHKHIGHVAQLRSKGQKHLNKHAERWVVPSIQVIDHPNAPLGSWHLGDRILLDLHVQWIGRTRAWHRIVADELSEDGTAILTLAAPGL